MMRGGFGGGGGRRAATQTAGALPVHATEQTQHMRMLKQVLPLLWHNGWKQRFQVIISFILLLCSKLLDLFLPLSIKSAVDDLVAHTFPLRAIILYSVFRFGGELLVEARNAIYSVVSAHIEKKVASDVFKHLQQLSLRYHLDRKTGAVLRSVSRGASSFAEASRVVLFQFLPVVLQVSIVCIYLFSQYHFSFGLITLFTIASYLVFTVVTSNWRDKFRREMNEKDNEYNQKAVDALLNFETVKYFCAEEHEQARIESALTEYRTASIKSQLSLSILNLGQNFWITLGIALVMWQASVRVMNDTMTIGDFVLVQQFLITLYTPLAFLGTYWRMVRQYLVDVESMFKILDEPVEVEDAPDCKELLITQGKIEFNDVSFSYTRPSMEDLTGQKIKPLLRNISFTVEPGMKVAIVGPSGSGKSTIARLLYRFYDVQDGVIRVDGQDIRNVSQRSLRKSMAVMPQDTVLFNASVGYNIAYGAVAHGRVASEEEIVDAAKAASLYDFIQSQEEKLETRVGERGLRLSGGEKQRVGIARALLKKPTIFVFDESTSALDSATEADIQFSINTVSKGFSSITIAHRLSTIVDSDLILVLQNGEIVERGTHDGLLAKHGVYANMWARQLHTAHLQQTIANLTERLQNEEQHSDQTSLSEVKIEEVDESEDDASTPSTPATSTTASHSSTKSENHVIDIPSSSSASSTSRQSK